MDHGLGQTDAALEPLRQGFDRLMADPFQRRHLHDPIDGALGVHDGPRIGDEAEEPVGGELLLSPQSVEIIKFGDPGSGR